MERILESIEGVEFVLQTPERWRFGRQGRHSRQGICIFHELAWSVMDFDSIFGNFQAPCSKALVLVLEVVEV